MTLEHNASTALYDLVEQLSTELDLHYEDGELSSLQNTVQVMVNAVGVMKRNDFQIPDAYHHFMGRYRHSGAQVTNPVTEE